MKGARKTGRAWSEGRPPAELRRIWRKRVRRYYAQLIRRTNPDALALPAEKHVKQRYLYEWY